MAAVPTSFVLGHENWDTGQVVTVSAEPGSAPATATTAFGGSASVAVTVVDE